MITVRGTVTPGSALLAAADKIKLLSYKVNTPKQFQVMALHGEEAADLMAQLGELIGHPHEKLDFVYFSACKGAEEHVDELDPMIFEETTFVVPLILPQGRSVLTANCHPMTLELNHVYEFSHELPHRLDLEDTESGCVVVMVAVLK